VRSERREAGEDESESGGDAEGLGIVCVDRIGTTHQGKLMVIFAACGASLMTS
jgi:hypothetical protein